MDTSFCRGFVVLKIRFVKSVSRYTVSTPIPSSKHQYTITYPIRVIGLAYLFTGNLLQAVMPIIQQRQRVAAIPIFVLNP